jgi:hypothetical protein
LYALKGIGGINTVLHQDQIMYIYLRVDIPLHHGKERLVSKYVLITWQNNGAASEISIDDDIVELSLGDPIADGLTPSRPDAISRGGSGSSLLRKAVAHVHGREIYRLFPHHVHFFASSLTEITEEAVRERLRRAVDNDCMLLRVVCIQPTGDAKPPTCIEVPFDATVAQLKQEISLTIGIPEERQRIVWFRQTEEFENGII